ncbi:MAG: carbohydrate-binding domain-containing protein [Peptococcaceae bacterium]|nr:carbohydrate-binding domain-containing protein [Peptococcaceae bacterium]
MQKVKNKLVCIICFFLVLLTSCSNNEMHANSENKQKYADAPLDFVEIIVDKEGCGWKWYAEEKVLVLDGLELYWDGTESFSGSAITVPPDSVIKLSDGSVNIIGVMTSGGNISAIVCEEPNGNITFEGDGQLILKGESRYGIDSNSGTVAINSGNISIQDDKNWAIAAGNELIINGGTIESEIGVIEAREAIVINGGDISLASYGDCMRSEFKNEIILNGGNVALKWLPGYEADWADYTEKQMAIHTSDDKWTINDGNLFTTGIYTNGIFEVNGGNVTVSDAGLNVGIRGAFIQNGGNVSITSDYAGIGNWVYSAEDNVAENRVVLNSGELDITCTDERYNAIELILEKKRGQNVLGTGIIIGDNMKINDGEWITEDITKDSEIRLRDDLQDFSEEREYLLTALQSKQVSITSQ